MSVQALTSLLRPPVEMASAIVSLSIAILLVMVPEQWLLVPVMAYSAAVLVLVLGAWRFIQGYKLIRYHRLLRRIPHWSMAADEIPWSRQHLFLGRGFEWTQTHTIRLYETLTEAGQKYLRTGRLYMLAREIERAAEHNRWLTPIAQLTRTDTIINPVRPLPPVGGNSALHAVGLYEYDGERNVLLKLVDRQGHTIVLGTTGVGKTRLAELLITQDILRGDVVIVLDPKGDADLLLQMYLACALAGRLDKFLVFHLGHPELSARYNPVGSFERITEVATRIATRLPGEGQSAAFREFVWRYVNNISRALSALGVQITYDTILEHAQDIEPLYQQYLGVRLATVDPDWERHIRVIEDDRLKREIPKQLKGRAEKLLRMIMYAREMEVYDDIASALHKTWEYDKSYFDKLVASLLPLLEKLVTGSAGALLSPDYLDDSGNPIFDWFGVIRTGSVVYVGLDALSDAEVAGVVGSSMMADLTSVAGRIYKHGLAPDVPHAPQSASIQLHADEFNELIQDEFIPMLNKARGAGINVTAYTQSLADIHVRLGSGEKAKQVIDNFNNVIMMRVRSAETAEILTSQLPMVTVPVQTLISSATDNANPDTDIDFTSQSQFRTSTERVPMVDAHSIVQLPKGQAFALLAGGQLYKLRLPLAQRIDMDLPDNIHQLADRMRKTYRSDENWAGMRDQWGAAA